MRWFPIALLGSAALAAAQTTPPAAATPDSEKKKIRVEGSILSLNGESFARIILNRSGMQFVPM